MPDDIMAHFEVTHPCHTSVVCGLSEEKSHLVFLSAIVAALHASIDGSQGRIKCQYKDIRTSSSVHTSPFCLVSGGFKTLFKKIQPVSYVKNSFISNYGYFFLCFH